MMNDEAFDKQEQEREDWDDAQERAEYEREYPEDTE